MRYNALNGRRAAARPGGRFSRLPAYVLRPIGEPDEMARFVFAGLFAIDRVMGKRLNASIGRSLTPAVLTGG
ncbi:MAG: hypothetical protein JOZ29_05390 [Deltaproteobacteria bacterium]|nr:hypothetical protein [Deltaproteobacteria bacterium]